MPRPDAKQLKTNTSNFDGILSSADTDVQKALDTLDNAVALTALSAGRNANNTTNVYLRGPDGTVMNLAGYVLDRNMTIVGIGAATDGAETWVAEVRRNGVATVLASLALRGKFGRLFTSPIGSVNNGLI